MLLFSTKKNLSTMLDGKLSHRPPKIKDLTINGIVVYKQIANAFEANAELPAGILKDYGLGIHFAIFPKN